MSWKIKAFWKYCKATPPAGERWVNKTKPKLSLLLKNLLLENLRVTCASYKVFGTKEKQRIFFFSLDSVSVKRYISFK